MRRRTFLGASAATGLAVGLTGAATLVAPSASAATWTKRLTGADLDTAQRWQVGGTDLGIPYVLENGSIGYLFGDTFAGPWPESGGDWRSPVILRSAVHPGAAGGIVFDSAAGVAGDGRAPEVMHNGHNGPGIDGVREVTVIPNDGIAFPETGRQVISYMSIADWSAPYWRTNYAGLAYSDNGNDFVRTPLRWNNNGSNTDPMQMWTMQRDGDWVYVFSVRSGRQPGPMMLHRVPWERMFFPADYQGWGWNGTDWGWGRPATPILDGVFGEPSVRRLADGTWVMAYLDLSIASIVTRTAAGPDQPWSAPKLQVTALQEPSLYGGFIHPWSTTAPNDLHLLVSTWRRDAAGNSTAYHTSQYRGTV